MIANKLGFALAQARYRLGLSSIAELSQAQLQQTSAEVGNTNARCRYRVALASLNYEEGANPWLIVLLRSTHTNNQGGGIICAPCATSLLRANFTGK
jgi:hypothetical protein